MNLACELTVRDGWDQYDLTLQEASNRTCSEQQSQIGKETLMDHRVSMETACTSWLRVIRGDESGESCWVRVREGCLVSDRLPPAGDGPAAP